MNINEYSWGGYFFVVELLVLTAGGVMATLNARKHAILYLFRREPQQLLQLFC
tara:strand:- start:95516 stop:95674 length:159 start_codon:yes stop_codon:yes gene_type:complete